jgi:hypothetical protein
MQNTVLDVARLVLKPGRQRDDPKCAECAAKLPTHGYRCEYHMAAFVAAEHVPQLNES